MRKKQLHEHKFRAIFVAAILMYSALIFFKFIPMSIWGSDILYDASAHITTTVLFLYCLWHLIGERRSLRISFYVFAILVLIIVGLQRIYVNAHNLTGIGLGLLFSLVSVFISQKYYLKNKEVKAHH